MGRVQATPRGYERGDGDPHRSIAVASLASLASTIVPRCRWFRARNGVKLRSGDRRATSHDRDIPTGSSMLTLIILAVPLGIALVLALKSFGINQEYERGVVFRLGRLQATKGPGWFWLIPLIERVVKVDIRTITYALDTQETVTRDGVAVRVNAVLWFRAFDAAGVVTTVANWQSAIVQAAETAMRDAIGQSDLDQMLKDRTAINKRLYEILTTTCIRWGVEFDAVEIKDLDIPAQMQRAIAREAEAIREKRARIIKAEGEQEAARKLADAAQIIGEVPGALELRRLQTLTEIGVEHNSTIIAMFPTEILEAAKRIGLAPAA